MFLQFHRHFFSQIGRIQQIRALVPETALQSITVHFELALEYFEDVITHEVIHCLFHLFIGPFEAVVVIERRQYNCCNCSHSFYEFFHRLDEDNPVMISIIDF